MADVRGCSWCAAPVLLAFSVCRVAFALEPVTLESVVPPGPNRPDEPLAAEFSLERAAHFLDSASLDWQKSRRCFACHTNVAYLLGRPSISADAPAHYQVRKHAEANVAEVWATKGPRKPVDVVVTATILAFNDAATTGKLHPLSRQALDRMWTVQRHSGQWPWPMCNWPPMESDEHYGVTFAAIGVGAAPDNYAQTPAAQAGLERIRRYLKENPPPTLHHRAMVLWASTYHDNLMSRAQRDSVIDELLALQRADGGWGLAALGNWQRADGSPQDKAASDGYGTGFVIYVLRRAGVPASDPRLRNGIAWLKSNQRQSGRWFTRSLFKDSKHYITHTGTAYAVMALAACGERLGTSSE